MKKGENKPNEKYLLDSAINSLKYWFNEYKKVLLMNVNSWSINDEGECQFLGDLELMYEKEIKLRERYCKASQEVQKLKGKSEVEE